MSKTVGDARANNSNYIKKNIYIYIFKKKPGIGVTIKRNSEHSFFFYDST